MGLVSYPFISMHVVPVILFEKHPCTWMIPIYKLLIYKKQKMARKISRGPIQVKNVPSPPSIVCQLPQPPPPSNSPIRRGQWISRAPFCNMFNVVHMCVMQSIQVVGVVGFFWWKQPPPLGGFRNIRTPDHSGKLM